MSELNLSEVSDVTCGKVTLRTCTGLSVCGFGCHKRDCRELGRRKCDPAYVGEHEGLSSESTHLHRQSYHYSHIFSRLVVVLLTQVPRLMGRGYTFTRVTTPSHKLMHLHLLTCHASAPPPLPSLQVGIEDFSVLTFGSSAALVKGPDTAWDAATQLALLEQVNCNRGKPHLVLCGPRQLVGTGCEQMP